MSQMQKISLMMTWENVLAEKKDVDVIYETFESYGEKKCPQRQQSWMTTIKLN